MDNLTNDEINTLAMYNSEKARGIVHTNEWVAKMNDLQIRFDEYIMAFHLSRGNKIV
jgi:hypothetical protein